MTDKIYHRLTNFVSRMVNAVTLAKESGFHRKHPAQQCSTPDDALHQKA